MRYKLVVRHIGKHVSRYEFTGATAAWHHFETYKRDTVDGFYLGCEMWKRRDGVVATGLPGEQVWELVERFPPED